MQKRWYQIPKIVVIQNTLYLKILAKNTKCLGKKHPRYCIPKTPGRACNYFQKLQIAPCVQVKMKEVHERILDSGTHCNSLHFALNCISILVTVLPTILLIGIRFHREGGTLGTRGFLACFPQEMGDSKFVRVRVRERSPSSWLRGRQGFLTHNLLPVPSPYPICGHCFHGTILYINGEKYLFL